MAENALWIKFGSWHIFDHWEYDGDIVTRAVALCGRTGDRQSPKLDDRPKKEKSCENCLRKSAPE